MKIICTKSNLPLSLFIRAITGEDCSHLALVFESRNGGLMFESNLLGTHPRFFRSAQKHMTIVHESIIPLTAEQEDAAWELMVDKFDGRGYDFLGAIYLAWYKLAHRLFGTKIPSVNKWGSNDSYFCNELYVILEQVGAKNINISNGMMTPHDVWEALR